MLPLSSLSASMCATTFGLLDCAAIPVPFPKTKSHLIEFDSQ